MLKTFLGLIVLSVAVILFKTEFADLLHMVSHWHHFVSAQLIALFPKSQIGELVAHLLSLVLIPIIIALTPCFIYWLIYRTEMPNWLVVVWVVWVMLATIIGLG